MKNKPDLSEALLNCWKTTNQVTVYLIHQIDKNLWTKKIPGYPRKTIGMLAAHLHNVRCMWINEIEKRKLIPLTRLDSKSCTKKETLLALKQSSQAMLALLEGCIENGGKLPGRPGWLNFPNDVIHLLGYFVAHEAHHRGQILMAARQLGLPFTRSESGELWQWSKRRNELRK